MTRTASSIGEAARRRPARLGGRHRRVPRRDRLVRPRALVCDDPDRARCVPRRVDAGRALPRPGRRRRRQRRVARLRLRRGRPGALRLGCGDVRLRDRADRDGAARAQAVDSYRLQRRRVRSRRHARRFDPAPRPRQRRGCSAPGRHADGERPLRDQPAARHGRDLGVRLGARVRRVDPLQPSLDDPPVRADGVDRADARRALAADAVPLRRARGPSRRDLAVPALDAPRRSAPFACRSPIRSPVSATIGTSTSASNRCSPTRARTGPMLSLCLLDVDDFKQINDRFGHPAGDGVLSRVAARLRSDGEAFRLGGDEFALLLPDVSEPMALAAAQAIVSRLGAARRQSGRRPHRQRGRRDLPATRTRPRHADPPGRRRAVLGEGAGQEPGAARARRRRPDGAPLAQHRRPRAPGSAPPRRSPASSMRAHADSGSHSERVALFAGRIAAQLGLSDEEVELTRLAGSLHDLGKLAIPEEVLRKPAALTGEERRLMQRHPQIGYRMLASLGVDPIADWVLHQSERWDGTGYPEGPRRATRSRSDRGSSSSRTPSTR